MLPNIDPRQMKHMMRQMGISSEEIEAKRVVIECLDKNLIIENPQITDMSMKGNRSFQIVGEVITEEKSSVKIEDDDIELVSKETGVSTEEAKKELEKEKGDIAKAILNLKQN